MSSRLLRIDINCDLGESTHQRPLPDQAALFPYLSSCNIACGFHGGDPLFIEQAIRQAIAHGLRIGAHPSYPDRMNFGRKPMPLPPERLQAEVRYQVAALKGMAESLGGHLSYVKPHGALYNQMAFDEAIARPVLAAVKAIDPSLGLMGLAGSPLQQWVAAAGLHFIAEAFADRRYTRDGKLAPRTQQGAVLSAPQAVVEQAHRIITGQLVATLDGSSITIQADSLCLHGDHPQALAIAQALDTHFRRQGIQKSAS